MRSLSAAAMAGLMVACASPPPAPAPDPMLALLQSRGLAPPDAAQGDDAGARLVATAMGFLDVPYRYGGNSADEGFDCSGFTRHVVQHTLGLALPRRAADQATRAGLASVAADALAPGDLVFFNTQRRAYSHVGIYIGGGRFVHSPSAGQQVRVEEMATPYWARRFDGARRATGS
jgi:cell wall-associated NlpC family hydrolase